MKRMLVVLSCVVVACGTPKQVSVTPPQSVVVDGKIYTTVFQQKAAEYRALCYQAYNLAFLRLGQALTINNGKPRAIITDIDETVLDNSSYAAGEALKGKDYQSDTWKNFTSLAVSDTVPGALHFLQFAASNGVEVFYVTNREESERAGTVTNLKKFGFPNVDDKHLLMKQQTSGKEARRQQVASNYDVVLLLGDNLSDFTFLFDKKSTDDRNNNTNALAPLFGNKFIVLPNPNYGDWETALYQYNYKLTGAQKDSVLRSVIKPY